MCNSVIEKEWKEEDFDCKVIFTRLGHRCGYVGVPEGHFLYGLDYWDYIDKIDCHGGLTFSGFLDKNKEYWYFGFDCAHFGDGIDIKSLKKYGFQEEIDNLLKLRTTWYLSQEPFKTQEFCEEQCHSIVKQIKNINL